MQRKTLIQLALFLVILMIIFFFYDNYFKSLNNKNIINKETTELSIKKGINQINKITYSTKDLDGNSYNVQSESGEFNQNEPDLILLKNVEATIITKNSTPIKILSDKSLYNNINYNTNFYDNVIIIYKDHKIFSENFDLIFNEKNGTIYNNVIYKSLNTELRADKIDIDLVSKDSKIYMFNKSKNVKIRKLD